MAFESAVLNKICKWADEQLLQSLRGPGCAE